MNSKHTPKPWFVGGVRQKIDGQKALGIFWYDEAKKRDLNIASVWYDPKDGAGTDEARLIAAAPDLLAALKDLADYVSTELEGDSGTPFHDALDAANAAIAKATGAT